MARWPPRSLALSDIQIALVEDTMNSLDAAKQILSIARAIWKDNYVMDAGGAVAPYHGNGPYFDSMSDALLALRAHLNRKHYAELQAAICISTVAADTETV